GWSARSAEGCSLNATAAIRAVRYKVAGFDASGQALLADQNLPQDAETAAFVAACIAAATTAWLSPCSGRRSSGMRAALGFVAARNSASAADQVRSQVMSIAGIGG